MTPVRRTVRLNLTELTAPRTRVLDPRALACAAEAVLLRLCLGHPAKPPAAAQIRDLCINYAETFLSKQCVFRVPVKLSVPC